MLFWIFPRRTLSVATGPRFSAGRARSWSEQNCFLGHVWGICVARSYVSRKSAVGEASVRSWILYFVPCCG